MPNIETMKIVELGNTGVGKTTYMASMYGALQSKIEGFSLEAVNLLDGTRLREYEQMILRGGYPPATSEAYKSYHFHLCYEGRKTFQFFWHDYRGVALRERVKTSEDAQKLQQDLREADGIIIFCDCNALSNREQKCISDISRITSLLSESLANLERPVSLAIMFTKVDMVKNFSNNLLDPLRGLLDAIALNNKVSGALIPVSCGKNMINVQLPLLFALQAGVQFKVSFLKNEIDKHKRLANSHRSQGRTYQNKSSGFGGWARDVWREHILEVQPYSKMADGKFDQAQRESNRAQEKLKVYEPLVMPANALDLYLQSTPRIEAGKSAKKYIKQLSEIKSNGFRQFFSSLFS